MIDYHKYQKEIDDILKDTIIIKHIPHSSLLFPEDYDDDNLKRIYGLDYKIQNIKLADLFVDYLFKDIKGIEIKAKYSRMHCDVEKYRDNKKEIMSKYGLGYIYTKNIFNNKPYHRNLIQDKKDIDTYYDNHHRRLTNETKKILSKGQKVLILDLHSYSDEQALLIGKQGPFPDICIGINDNDNQIDQRLLNLIIKIIKDYGYTYQINYPYRGSVIPNNLTPQERDHVSSIMIEINKRVYL